MDEQRKSENNDRGDGDATMQQRGGDAATGKTRKNTWYNGFHIGL